MVYEHRGRMLSQKMKIQNIHATEESQKHGANDGITRQKRTYADPFM